MKINAVHAAVLFMLFSSAVVAKNPLWNKDSLKVTSLLASAESCIMSGSKECGREMNHALALAAQLNSPYLKAACYCLFATGERKYRSQQLLDYDAAALEQAKKSGNDSLVLHCLLRLSHDWCNANKTDVAEQYVKEYKALVAKNSNPLLKLRAAYETGYYLSKKNDFDAARESYLQALTIANTLNNERWIALIKRGVYQCEVLGFHPEKQAAFIFEAYNYFSRTDEVETANCLSVTGRAFLLNGNTAKARAYFESAAGIFSSKKYLIEAAESSLAVAETCLPSKQLASGIAATAKAESLFKSAAYPRGKITSLIMYGRLYNAAGRYEKAAMYFKQVDSLLEIYPDKTLQFLYLGSVVEKYRVMGNLNGAGDTIMKTALLQMELMPAYVVLRFAQKGKANGLLSAEELLDIKRFTKTGRIDSALWNRKQDLEGFNPFTGNLPRFDSNYNALYNRQQVEMETKFKTKAVQDSLDKSNMVNRLKEEKINRQYGIIGFVTALTLLTGLLLYRNYKEKKRAQEDAATIALLKEEADHRVKNIFSNIGSIIRDVKRKTGDTASIENIEQRIEPVRLLYSMLGDKTTGAVALQPYFEVIASSLQTFFMNTGQVQVLVDAPVMLEWPRASKLGLIVNELLTNSFKYAFKESGSGTITVSCNKDDSGKFRLTVSDNGSGLPATAAGKQRGGLTQVKALAQQLDATCEMGNTGGAHFEFLFL